MSNFCVIQVEGTTLYVVYVAYDGTGIVTNELTTLARGRDPRFTYHRLDLQLERTNCRRFFSASIEGY